MNKIKRGRLSRAKRQMLEEWGKYPALSVMYRNVNEYAAALRKVEARVRQEEGKEEVEEFIEDWRRE